MDIVTIIISLFVILFAITIHEAAHGWAAYKLGDPTAHIMGRVTLNPVPHIDPIGTVLMPAILIIMGAPPFGWAKPVPVNPANLKNPKRDNMLISAAGPAANLLAAFVSLIAIVLLKAVNPNTSYFIRSFLMGRGGIQGGFRPMEGLAVILFYAVFLNVLLAVFNLIPIPPLDGSGIITGFLSEEASRMYDKIRPFGFIIILGLLYLGLLNLIIRPIQIVIISIIL
ncbi:MAG: site-2 protease family protein [Candidatus Aminicenantes bacterium]|nr:site-2 protease family protein [Candidatus Aminicenantes bacterium]HHF52042.1 site-2 protease family protein [Candidatus Aminicenantes bacterium]